ncbi:MAG TPA: nucleotidyltransferase [Leptolinea sp.]
MPPIDHIKIYRPLLKGLQNIFEIYPGKGVIIGGIAVSLLGEPRLTADVDVLILLSATDISGFIEEAIDVGINPRIKDAETFAKLNRVLLMTYSETNTNVDIILGMLPFEEEVLKRSRQVTVGDLDINLPTVEDLIIMKAVADRPKDIIDIQGLVKTNSNLDMKRIEYWVRIFAEGIDKPDLWQKTNEVISLALK